MHFKHYNHHHHFQVDYHHINTFRSDKTGYFLLFDFITCMTHKFSINKEVSIIRIFKGKPSPVPLKAYLHIVKNYFGKLKQKILLLGDIITNMTEAPPAILIKNLLKAFIIALLKVSNL